MTDKQKFIAIKPRENRVKTNVHKRMQGVNFKFAYQCFCASKKETCFNEHLYINIGIGQIPQERLFWKGSDKVKVSYDSSNNIIKLEKTSESDNNKEEIYTLTNINPSLSKNTLLRLRFRWLFSKPSKKLFGAPMFVEYEIHKNFLLIYLDKISSTDIIH